MKKTITARFTAALLALSLPVVAAAAPPAAPSDLYFVSDFAGVLQDDTMQLIAQNGERLANAVGPEIALVTVDFTDGVDIGEYTTDLLNSWGVGAAERNDGLLILMAIGDDNYYAAQGIGLEQKLSAGDIDTLLYEYLEADFDAKNYDAGAKSVYRAFVEKLGGTWSEGSAAAGSAQTGKYVADGAGVISTEAFTAINSMGDSTQAAVGGAVHVVTVDTTGPEAIETYAERMFDERRLTGTDALYLMVIGDDDFYVHKGEYLDGVLTSRALDTVVAQADVGFTARDYSQSALDTVGAISKLMTDNAAVVNPPQQQVTPDNMYDYSYGYDYGYSYYGGGFFTGALVFILIIAILISSLTFGTRRRYYRRYYGVPFNPFAPRYVRRYGPGGYWGHYGGPRPGFHHMPPPGRMGFFGPRPPRPPRPPRGGTPMGGMRPPGGTSSGGSRPPGGISSSGGKSRPTTPSPGGSFGGFGGGVSRGSGAGRSTSSWGSSGGSRPSGGSFGGAGRSSSGGGRSGGGGASRGSGAGRRR